MYGESFATFFGRATEALGTGTCEAPAAGGAASTSALVVATTVPARRRRRERACVPMTPATPPASARTREASASCDARPYPVGDRRCLSGVSPAASVPSRRYLPHLAGPR